MPHFQICGPDFDDYVLNILGGTLVDRDSPVTQAVRPVIERVCETVFSAGETFFNGKGKTLTLDIGVASFELGTAIALPNAFAALHHGKPIIVIHTNVISHFWSLASDLMGCDEFLPEIGEPSEGRASVPPDERSFGFADYDPSNLDGFSERLIKFGPSCPMRRAFALFFRDLMIEIVIMHEVGHVIRGHVDLMVSAERAALGNFQVFQTLTEFEADIFSSNLLVLRMLQQDRFTDDQEFAQSEVMQIKIQYCGKYLVGWTLVMSDVLINRNFTDRSSINLLGYPPSEFRLRLAEPSYESVLVDDFGFDPSIAEAGMGQGLLQMAEMAVGFPGLVYLALPFHFEDDGLVLQRIERAMKETRFVDVMREFRYAAFDATGARAGTEAESFYAKKRVAYLNNVDVSPGHLAEAMKILSDLPSELRQSLVHRSEAIAKFVKSLGIEDSDGSIFKAVLWRTESLVACHFK